MTTNDGTTGARADAIELLVSDHREVDQYFHLLEQAGNGEAASHAAESIVRDLSIHAVIEEQVLYPMVRQVLPDGDQLADHSLEEHREVKEILAELDGKPVDDPTVRARFRELADSVKHHVAEEEGTLFPRLRQHLDEEKLMRMGDAMNAAKRMAPTHPHPNAPDRPPGNVVIGMAAAVMDKVRDAARQAMS